MVVISVQIDLIDVPSRVDIISVRVQHNRDMKFCVVEYIDCFLIAFCPTVDVPLCRQQSEGCAQVFIPVMAAIDIDDFFRTSIEFGLHRPI